MEHYMKRALKLARRGSGKVSPNPLVGAVVVKDGRVLGEGFHRAYGEKHAETRAIESAIEPVAGADLYCTLEPCCFTGPEKHQPPCTDLIIRSGIRKVFIAMLDPNPKVRGKGVEILRQKGVEVSVGILADEARRLNEGFITYHTLGRPFVHLKIAQTLDGRIASKEGDSRWITDEHARRQVHQWRARYDAVLIGKNTVQVDDPELTVRFVEGRNPIRVVLDSTLSLPLDRKIFHPPDPEKTFIVTGPDFDLQKRKALETRGITVLSVSYDLEKGDELFRRLNLGEVLTALGDRGIRSILVEGGGALFTSFLKSTVYDRITFFIAPRVLGTGINTFGDLGFTKISQAIRLEQIRIRHICTQIQVEGYRPGFLKETEVGLVPGSETVPSRFQEISI